MKKLIVSTLMLAGIATISLTSQAYDGQPCDKSSDCNYGEECFAAGYGRGECHDSQRGCCAHHDGVKGCAGYDHRIECNDDWVSNCTNNQCD